MNHERKYCGLCTHDEGKILKRTVLDFAFLPGFGEGDVVGTEIATITTVE